MKLGIVLDGTDRFLNPITVSLEKQFEIDYFQPRFVRLPLIGKRINDVLLIRQMHSFLENHDVVFFEWAGPLAALASKLTGRAKRIVRAHRTELFNEVKKIDWSNVDRIVVTSEAMRTLLLKRCPEAEAATRVIYNGVKLSHFRPDYQSFKWRIGMMGNLVPRKRVYDVICSLATLPEHVPWQFVVGGPPVESHTDYWYALQNLVQVLGITEQVSFVGPVEDTSSWFQSIDIYISASYSEGHQFALLEALASGCYCLGHCWAGIDEVLPPDNIFVTGDELRQKLLVYADLPEKIKQHKRQQMRQIAEERFDLKRNVAEIAEVIQSTL